MAISNVVVEDGCTVCGLCEQVCPEVFTMGSEKAEVKSGADLAANEEKVKEAADGCPVSVIKVS